MKKFFAIAIMAVCTLAASAQITWKPNVGITYTTISNAKDAKGAIGLTAGIEGLYMVDGKFGVSAGVNLTGNNVKDNTVDKISSNYYVNIPVMANYYVAEGFAVKAGLGANILASAKVDGESEILGTKVSKGYKGTYFSLPVGVSYEIGDIVLDARYDIGLSNATEIVDSKYSRFAFTVGYKF